MICRSSRRPRSQPTGTPSIQGGEEVSQYGSGFNDGSNARANEDDADDRAFEQHQQNMTKSYGTLSNHSDSSALDGLQDDQQ